MRPRHFMAAAFLGIWLFTGCTVLRRPAPVISPDSLTRISRIEDMNRGLLSFKGVGRMVLEGRSGRRVARVAWLAAPPDRFRAAVLQASGQPAATLLTDGRRVTVLNHLEHREANTFSSDPTLEDVLGVSIPMSELLGLVIGRPPLGDYDDAALVPGEPGEILVLKRRGQVVRKLFLAPGTGEVTRMDVFSADGHQSRRVTMIGETSDGRYRFRSFRVEAPSAAFSLEMERIWTDAPVAADAFSL